jgi:Cu-Zn family superoxide dismutase
MTTMKGFFALGAALGCAALGCGGHQTGTEGGGGAPAENRQATAVIEPKSGTSTSGAAMFTTDGKTVTLQLDVTGAPPGEHAVHIHEKPDCSADDATSAGDHWNPTNMAHGKPNGGPFHLGDIGNMKVGDDGKGSLTFRSEKWAIGTGQMNDVVNHAIVIHAGADDFTTQPSGASGARIGCGVIKR